ncbi:MAG: hypothetical protein IPL53_04000 [Ignavibacteria bacterium]|nr:hypothetical protein [Ignavibacteria bacterium]
MLIRKTGLPDIIDTITVSDSTNHFSYSYTSGYKIKLIHSGFYNTSTNKLNMRDTVKAYLRNTFSPFSIVDSSTSILDSITMYADFKFNHAPSGNYYIVLNHRNMLETWSKEGGESFVKFSVNEYDFTSAQSQAYGNNLKQIGSVFGCFAGDVNKDSFIDLTDLISVNNNALDFAAGYKPSDLNGDNITDLTDLVLVYNNSTNFVKVIRP